MCYYVEYIEKFENYFLNQFGEILDENTIDAALILEVSTYHFVGGFEHPKFPVVFYQGVGLMEWGLIPNWIKNAVQAKDIRTKTLNAVSETAFEKPSYRDSIKKRRCLLNVTAFFEWRDLGGKKYPYRISLKQQGTFALGCIYDKWVDKETGEIMMTFSVLTTKANDLMEKIHNLKKRMPLIIDRNDFKKWLDPDSNKEEVIQLMQPFPSGKMTAYTIGQYANSTRNNRNIPEISSAVTYPEIDEI